MYLQYSVEGNPHQTVPLTTFTFYDQVNGVNLYSASVQTTPIDFCDECSNTEDQVHLEYTMELVTPDPLSPAGSNIYIPYPACSHFSESDIFSCTVFTSAVDCTTGDCSNTALTYSSGSLLVCNEEGNPPAEVDNHHRSNNDQNIADKVNSKTKLHPYYWAAFVPFREMEAITLKSNTYYWYYLLAATLLVFAFIFYKKQ